METALKGKYSRDSETSVMLDMIVEGISLDAMCVYGSSLGEPIETFREILVNSKNCGKAMSTMASIEKSIMKNMAAVAERYEKIEYTSRSNQKMAYLNIIYMNHLDLTWRRARYSAISDSGFSITPYSELQERQIDAGLDFIRQGGAYDIEQSISLKEYIERNPDALDEIREYMKNGSLYVLGGGSAVIDYNLPDGESIIRNHLYSRLWLQKEFGVKPVLAACPDTFGLSAGLPGLFRQLGYKGILHYHRVFRQNKPYFRGLSGDVIALDSGKALQQALWIGTDFKNRVCGLCHGGGCSACGGSGLELRHTPGKAEELRRLDAGIKAAVQKFGDASIWFAAEEATIPDGAVGVLRSMAEKHHLTPRFLSAEDLACEYSRDLLDGADTADENDIDPRCEGNPVAAGCYTSRIRLKQENRKIESLLRSAEHLSVAASICTGLRYPAKTLAGLWEKLAFFQFHDALPGSHSDKASEELLETGRALKASARRLIDQAIKALSADVSAQPGEDDTFILINPLEFPVNCVPLTGVIKADKVPTGGYVFSPDGKRLPITKIVRSEGNPDDRRYAVSFYGDLPALGYALFRFVPDTDNFQGNNFPGNEVVCQGGEVMENEYLRVTFTDHSIAEIYDKQSGKSIACEGTFSPVLSDDAGHLWGRDGSIQYRERADRGDYFEYMVPSVMSRQVFLCRKDGIDRARIEVRYERKEHKIHHLSWVCELTLPKHAKELHVHIHTEFDAKDIRLSTQICLPEPPKDGQLDYEIPLGVVRRGAVCSWDEQLGFADEWPALRYVTARLDGVSVTLCNSGTPGHAIDGNVIRVSLLRHPTELCCGYGIEKASMAEENEYDFTLSAAAPTVYEAYCCGMVLNTEFPAYKAVCPQSALQGSFLSVPTGLPLLALKGAEDGDGYILRYLGAEETTTFSFSAPVAAASILEEKAGESVSTAEILPFTITTFHTDGEALKKR
ncbi:MAG: hypothetical protein MJ175_04555 [Clostridia bacterium]|nr:hypothetical protein [Clostridia bacterium]